MMNNTPTLVKNQLFINYMLITLFNKHYKNENENENENEKCNVSLKNKKHLYLLE